MVVAHDLAAGSEWTNTIHAQPLCVACDLVETLTSHRVGMIVVVNKNAIRFSFVL